MKVSLPYKAMKAQEIESLKELDLRPYVVESKLDGWWVELHRHSNGDPTELWTRRMKPVDGRGADWLKGLAWPAETIVVGELYVPGGSSPDVTHELANGGERFRFAVFDVLQYLGGDLVSCELSMRIGYREMVVRDVNDARVHQVEWELGASPKVQAFIERLLAQGEGVIVKELRSPYRPGQCLRDWLKRKVTRTVDVIITDCDSKPSRWRVRPGQKGTDGQVYPEGLETDPWRAGHCGLSYGYWDPARGVPVRAGSLGITGPKEQLEQHVGKVAEVKVWGVYPGSRLRHPQHQRWREDKAPDECLKPEVR